MKINTNLTPSELALVAKGLLVASEHEGHYKPENPAERALNSHIDTVFATFCQSLGDSFQAILTKE